MPIAELQHSSPLQLHTQLSKLARHVSLGDEGPAQPRAARIESKILKPRDAIENSQAANLIPCEHSAVFSTFHSPLVMGQHILNPV